MMKKNKFYSFDSKLIGSNVMAVPDLPKFPPTEERASRRLIKGEYGTIEFPIVFEHKEGKNFTDILDTGFPSLYLISNRLKILLEDNCYTGWKTYPTIFLDKKGNEIKGYHGFSITGRSGPKDYTKSEIIKKQDPMYAPTFECYKGFTIDESLWDGSDFFLLENTVWILVNESVANMLINNKVSNVVLPFIEDIEIPLNMV